jgi:hypothetical protein
MKAYPNKITMPQRMSRKRMRRDVFVANNKATHARKKTARLERKALAASLEVE